MSYRVDQGAGGLRRARGRRGWISTGVTGVVVVALGVLWACVPRGPVGPAPAPPAAPQGFVASAVARPSPPPPEPLRVGAELERELRESVRAPAAPVSAAAPAAPLFRISARHEMSSTMYCLKGRTRTGIRTRDGVAAADPEFLPLGSVVRLSSREGRPLGVFVVMDTGGAVKGRKIDIYVDDCDEARRWGRRQVTAEVLDLGRDAV
ncbi:MAG: 3D domain-containing protein [Longimicrobiaceae bacterium]